MKKGDKIWDGRIGQTGFVMDFGISLYSEARTWVRYRTVDYIPGGASSHVVGNESYVPDGCLYVAGEEVIL